tara:strand:+ start:26 stop:136 length:111 start_codon:yes stop_codon:yes gene_type:complete
MKIEIPNISNIIAAKDKKIKIVNLYILKLKIFRNLK